MGLCTGCARSPELGTCSCLTQPMTQPGRHRHSGRFADKESEAGAVGDLRKVTRLVPPRLRWDLEPVTQLHTRALPVTEQGGRAVPNPSTLAPGGLSVADPDWPGQGQLMKRHLPLPLRLSWTDHLLQTTPTAVSGLLCPGQPRLERSSRGTWTLVSLASGALTHPGRHTGALGWHPGWTPARRCGRTGGPASPWGLSPARAQTGRQPRGRVGCCWGGCLGQGQGGGPQRQQGDSPQSSTAPGRS